MTRRDEKGQNLVELAVVSMVLLLMLAGAIDIGRVFNNYIIVTNAAREGARIATRYECKAGVPGQPEALHDAIVAAVLREAANSGVTLNAANVEIDPDPAAGCGGLTPGSPVKVSATHEFAIIMSDLLALGQIRLKNWTVMAVLGGGY